ncbi:peptide-methionine (S)-S-oxide reductase MsrA [Rhodanobacter glycinis]|uniref:Peptide methionine sulfoxide reductase MsrA n=1 Tax=Rhodanobacter glycinis TaxID=582702 RepID=A0A5B9E3I9_9GAMM|nr:peptide-methionine (S)-S-oxide reductase MsrA [Rhodanobacter glycinis]QEE25120.1 peptide-methionine (S)-S-oxide reductase MsrA [Rhodanobacter glycinis]
MRHRPLAHLVALVLLAGLAACSASAAERPVPAPTLDAPKLTTPQGDRTAVFAGGCFWGMQAVFEHVRGVRHVWAGYTGGSAATANYADVSDGDTGHAESIELRFDPSVVSYGQLLQVYFAVAHDPTELNRQGPDSGTQYRSEIFYANPMQQRVADAYIAQLTAAKVFAAPIVTRVAPLHTFYMGEAYHQNYVQLHPNNLYVAINDAPKLTQLKRTFPALYQETPTLVDVQLH